MISNTFASGQAVKDNMKAYTLMKDMTSLTLKANILTKIKQHATTEISQHTPLRVLTEQCIESVEN